MEMIRELYAFKGYTIKVTTDDGIYEGVLMNLCPQLLKILLAKVVVLPERTIHLGNSSFFAGEINSYSVVSDGAKVNRPSLKQLNVADLQVSNLRYVNGSSDGYAKEIHPNEDSEEEILVGNEEDEKFTLVLPEQVADQLPEDYVIVDQIDSIFYKAVKHINEQTEVGVSFEGENISRFGELWWIVISSHCCTFLFDIYQLKAAAFQEGIKDILESDKVQKVIHDSRLPSDILFHKHDTKLNNIFDTQVADVFANMQNSRPGKVGKHVQPLSNCLIKYLSLISEQASFGQRMNTAKKSFNSQWIDRPLCNFLLDQAIKGAIYLRILQQVQMKQMFKSFYSAIEIYLRVVRNATLKELELEPSSPHLLPEAVISAGLQTFHMKEITEHSAINESERQKAIDKMYPQFVCPAVKPVTSKHRHVRKDKKSRCKLNDTSQTNCSSSFAFSNGVPPEDTPKESSAFDRISIRNRERSAQTKHQTEKINERNGSQGICPTDTVTDVLTIEIPPDDSKVESAFDKLSLNKSNSVSSVHTKHLEHLTNDSSGREDLMQKFLRSPSGKSPSPPRDDTCFTPGSLKEFRSVSETAESAPEPFQWCKMGGDGRTITASMIVPAGQLKVAAKKKLLFDYDSCLR